MRNFYKINNMSSTKKNLCERTASEIYRLSLKSLSVIITQAGNKNQKFSIKKYGMLKKNLRHEINQWKQEQTDMNRKNITGMKEDMENM